MEGCPNSLHAPWTTYLLFQLLQWGASQFFRVDPVKKERNKEDEPGEGHMIGKVQNLVRGMCYFKTLGLSKNLQL